MFGGRTQFLPMITLYLTFMASVFAFLVDASEIIANHIDSIMERKCGGEIAYIPRHPDTLMISLRDEFMGTWVQTLCTFMSLFYWGTYLMGLSVIQHDQFTPIGGWFNHALHTIPVVWAFLTMIYVDYEYPSLCNVFKRMVGFTGVYLVWLRICSRTNGYWAYDFIGEQPILILANIFIFSLTLVSLMNRKVSTLLRSRIYREEIKCHDD